MNPFGENRTVHNIWSVILTMYNLPTWLCHRRKYLTLSILIQGLKQADTDINVFLEPPMKDMVKLWDEGYICGISISMSILHCMQSYLFVFMMLLRVYIIRTN
jgi:hypothetical protein